jgi:hypothetical protein
LLEGSPKGKHKDRRQRKKNYIVVVSNNKVILPYGK